MKTAPDSSRKLGEGKIPSLVTGFAGSALAGLVLNSVYSLTDALFIGRGVGDIAMGGVSVVAPFVILQGAISTAIGSGAASLVSVKLGEGKPNEAGAVTLNAMITFYIVAVVVTVIGFAAMTPLLKAMGATDELMPYARIYFTIILGGNIFSTGFSSIMRAEGKLVYSTLQWIIPITLNIVLDAVFIFALGWGVAGSAAATVASQLVSFVMSAIFFTRFTSQSFKGARLRLSSASSIIGIGVPALVQMGSLSIIAIVINNLIGKIDGSLGITAFGYISKLLTYSAVPFVAMAQGLAPVVGFNYGAGNTDRVKRAVGFSLAVCAGYAVLALALAEGVPRAFMRVFTDDGIIVDYGARFIRLLAPALLFLPLPSIAGAAMQAMGRKGLAMLFFASTPVLFIPLAFGLSRTMGTAGLPVAYIAAAFLATLLTAAIGVCAAKRFPAAPPYRRKRTDAPFG